MKANVKATIHYLRENGIEHEQLGGVCIRGFESYVHKPMYKQRKEVRQLAATAVFLEQEMQFDEKNFDVEAIAREYSTYASQCQEKALRWGLLDAQEAVTTTSNC
jgi:hypothetical protein